MDRAAAGGASRGRPASRDRPSPSFVRSTRQLAVELFSAAPRQTTVALLSLLLAGVTEAFGIVLLVPLLHTAGLGETAGENPIVDAMRRAAGAVGVEPSLVNVLGVFLALVALREAASWQRNRMMVEVRQEFVDRFREAIYRAVAGARWRFLVRQQRAEMQHVLVDNMARTGRSAETLLQLVVLSAFALAQTGLAFVISPAVSAGALATGVGFALLARRFGERSHELGVELTDSQRTLHRSAADFLAGLKLVRSHDAAARHLRRSADAAEAMRRSLLALVRTESTSRAALHLGATAAVAALTWFAVSAAGLAIADLLVLALIFVRLVPILAGLLHSGHTFAQLLPAYVHARKFHRVLLGAAEPTGAAGPMGPAERPMPLRRGLSARNVWFSYNEAGPGDPVLSDISLEIPARKITAIAGPSGAGKTTLADVLLGLLEPDVGEVRADGVLLTGSNLGNWRRRVAYAPQDAYLLPGTIRDNLRWERPDASEAEMWEALGLAAGDFVAALPEGLDTVVGDRGVRLSGGECQRITLARALLRQPAVLVLDEPTSQLDGETERRILEALHSLRGRMTIVAVAHRTALAEMADHIVLLESGRVAAAGTGSELRTRIRAIEGATVARQP